MFKNFFALFLLSVFALFSSVKINAADGVQTILCFGDSNAWGHIAGSFNSQTGLCKRFEWNQRWAKILENSLGENYHVIEEAINGRTTTLDELIPGRPYRNGLTLLPVCLESHYPIDIVIFMLGTNDTKIQYNRSADEIAEGMRALIKEAKTSNKGRNGNPPKILLIAPQPIIKRDLLLSTLNDDSIKKSELLAAKYEQLAKEELCGFLDAARFVTSSPLDGIHLEENELMSLGLAVSEIIKKMQ